MVKEIIVLQEGGILLFHYSITGTKRMDELVAAFLSAVDSIAKQVRQDEITTISFAENKLVWEKKGNLFFVAMVSEGSSYEIFRVILKDLAEQFVSMYYADLVGQIGDLKKFRTFTDIVEATLHKFDGIPGLSRRYKTILLPYEELAILRKKMIEVELDRDILRGCLMTNDGHIAISHLRAYELETALDFIPIHLQEVEIREHASFDKKTGLLLIKIGSKAVAVFIVNLGLSERTYYELVTPFIVHAKETDFENARRIEPERAENRILFYDFDRVEPIASVDTIENELSFLLSSSSETARSAAFNLRDKLTKLLTVVEMQEKLSLPKDQLDELLAQLITRNIIRITKIFPIIVERDERFTAYLEVIGIKKKDFNVIDTVSKYCDGSYSIQEISERTNIPANRIMAVLRLIDDSISWSNKRVLSHDR